MGTPEHDLAIAMMAHYMRETLQMENERMVDEFTGQLSRGEKIFDGRFCWDQQDIAEAAFAQDEARFSDLLVKLASANDAGRQDAVLDVAAELSGMIRAATHDVAQRVAQNITNDRRAA